jgi:adenine-specific DNA-methyltransferase
LNSGRAFTNTPRSNGPVFGATSVPAWFLDTDYNGLCFHVCQAFFPRTSAWDNLKKVLKGTYDDTVWDHLAGTTSTPFDPG